MTTDKEKELDLGDAELNRAFEGIRNATMRAYLLELPTQDRNPILRSSQKIQELEHRIVQSQQSLGKNLMHQNPDEQRDNSKKEMESLLDLYHKSTTMPKPAFEQHYGAQYDARDVECEVRFGTNRKAGRAFSKLDYDKVIQQFQKAGFTTEDPEGMHMLRINTEYFNTKQQRHVFSNIRTEICGLDLVQQYVRTNNLSKLMHQHKMDDEFGGLDLKKIKFTQKRAPEIKVPGKDPQRLKPVEFTDFNFRVSYQMEKHWLPSESDVVQKTIENWVNLKKTFRFLNRVRFRHPKHPVFLDVSIIKGSATEYNPQTRQRVPIPEFTVQDANVFDNAESYEIELELDNSRMSQIPTSSAVVASVRHCIRLVLSGLQGSPFPIGFTERNRVLHEYMCLLHGIDLEQRHEKQTMSSSWKITSHHFVGPQPMTLQLEHIQPHAASTHGHVNIRSHYSVTDKADGERKLMFVSPTTGKVYLLDTTMNVVYTGRAVKDERQWNSLLDGEQLTRNRDGEAIHKYKVFDIYFWGAKSKRELAFYEPPYLEGTTEGTTTEGTPGPTNKESEKESSQQYEQRFRLPLLQKWVADVQLVVPKSKESKEESTKESKDTPQVKATDFVVEAKTFLTTYEKDIFAACKEIWEAIQHPAYEYHTDGLIFTPTHCGVGADRVGHAGPLHKFTWKAALKWKPPQFNTVDFLVRIKHTATRLHDVQAVYTPGTDLTRPASVEKFKTLTLCCGFNPRDHGYLNPQKMMLDGTLEPSQNSKDDYLPCAFEPADPADPEAAICEWTATDQGNGEYVLFTEEGEYFDEDMIVEFRYDKSRDNPRRRWIPLRVRYDKTNELRMGYKNYGNAFHVAESNWRSMWYEVTVDMITSGEQVPQTIQDDVYYNRVGGETSATKGLRQFHNHFVKRRLIQGVCHPGEQLLDLGVGKAGDLRKWADAGLHFVFGVDLSHDNIENRKDGACARYLGLFRYSDSKQRIVADTSADPSVLMVGGGGGGNGQPAINESSSSSSSSNLPLAIFLQGNVELNIRRGEAFSSLRDKAIVKALFGQGPRDKTELGLGVYPHYGAAERGFHVTSCQFAVHYFFKDKQTLHALLRNIAECTREQGYFLCTCFDGNRVFDRLCAVDQGRTFELHAPQSDHKMFGITKQYTHTEFPDDETSLGYAIDVYQDSINTHNREYLVHPSYFKREMENYGFVLVDAAEAKTCGFVSGTGVFDELFGQLEEQATENKAMRRDMERALHMTPAEKTISFLNRYYIFKKVRTVTLRDDKDKDQKQSSEHVDKKTATPTIAAVAVAAPATKKKNKFRALGQPVRLEIRPE